MNNLTRGITIVCLLNAFIYIIGFAQPKTPITPATSTTAPRKEILTNTSIIELAQLGLGDTIILEKMRQSECQFDTSLIGLKQLKAAKVSEAVIAAMMNPNAKPAPTTPAITTVSKPASGLIDSDGRPVPLPPDKGAYLWDGKTLTLMIQSQVPSMGVNVGRAIGSALNPFMKNKLELQLIGTNDQASFNHSQPLIIVSGLGDVIPGVPSYRLLYVKQGGMRKDRRILGTYDVGGFGSVAMVDNEIPCEIKKVTEGIYAIKPTKALADGEYGLVPVTRLADMQANQKSIAAPPVWDFGIYSEGKISGIK